MQLKDGEQLFVVHFGELWLRGRNRNQFIAQLLRNMAEQLKGERYSLSCTHDRIIIRLGKRSDIESIGAKLGKVFGVSKYELSYTTKADMKSIRSLASKMLKEVPKGTAVRIESHRSYKQHKFNSVKIISDVAAIAEKRGLRPTPRNFDQELRISVTKDTAFMHMSKKKGAGGLPVGTAGRAVVLLSGGIDSPVAAWYAMRRGVTPIYLHLHAYPSNNAKELSKIKSIVGQLGAYHQHYKLYLMPSSAFQLAALKSGSSETVLLKSFMLHIADKIADRENADLIYTGDCLGQVASQTSGNLLAESYGISRPIMRPLIGFDKEEIIKLAREIGTYEPSIVPYKDVCSISAKNPNTHVALATMQKLIKQYKIKALAAKAVRTATIIEK